MTAVKPRMMTPSFAKMAHVTAAVEREEDKPAAPSFSEQELVQARRELLAWYDVNHRILPWRRNASSKRPVDGTEGEGAPLSLPQQQFIYYVWVSEVMSQQTQVPRAAEYFRRWMQKFPTVQALALATEDEVNAMWAGLGYYRRARFLLAGARYVVGELGGQFPICAAELRKIPGVGAYTGNAIASIACLEPVAVVDANVVRVVSRLRRLAGDPRSKAAVATQTALADALLDPQRPGDFNQAVMELGATVCTVHQPPSCAVCPLRNICQAYADVQAQPQTAPPVTAYPAKVEKAQRREETVAVAVVTLTQVGHDDKYLLLQRPKDGLLAGLWEFPAVKVAADASNAECRRKMDRLLEGPLGMPLAEKHVVSRQGLGEIVHIFSHIRMTMRVETMHIDLKGDLQARDSVASEDGEDRAIKWLSKAQLEQEGLSSGVKKVYALVSQVTQSEKRGIKRFFKHT